MRLAEIAGPLAMLLGAGCTCEAAPASEEPASPPSAPDERAPEPAPLEGTRAVDGGYFQLSVPEGWAARRTLRTMVLEAPAERAALRVIVSRPVPFEGDAAAFAETLRPAFERAGFEGDPGRAGQLGDTDARVIDGVGAGATARYWFVVVEGHGISFSCTGRVAPAEQIEALCDRLAASFRITGSPAPHALLERGDEVDIGGLHFQKPEGWELVDAEVQEGIVAALRAGGGEEGVGATLGVEDFDGDLAALRERARAAARDGGYAIAFTSGALLGHEAASYVVDQPEGLGGRRARVIETIDSGRAIRLSCYGPPGAFERVNEACGTLAASLGE